MSDESTEDRLVRAMLTSMLLGTKDQAADAVVAYREWIRADERQQARQRVAQVSGTLDPDGVRYRERVIAAAGGDA